MHGEKSHALAAFFLLPLSRELWRNKVLGGHNQQPQAKMSQLFEDCKRKRRAWIPDDTTGLPD